MSALTSELHEVEVEFETIDGTECEYEYKNTMLGEKAKIKKRRPDGHKSKTRDETAKAEVMRIVREVAPHPAMRGDELIDRTCQALGVDRANLRRMEVEIEFKNGNEISGKI